MKKVLIAVVFLILVSWLYSVDLFRVAHRLGIISYKSLVSLTVLREEKDLNHLVRVLDVKGFDVYHWVDMDASPIRVQNRKDGEIKRDMIMDSDAKAIVDAVRSASLKAIDVRREEFGWAFLTYHSQCSESKCEGFDLTYLNFPGTEIKCNEDEKHKPVCFEHIKGNWYFENSFFQIESQ